MYLGVDLGTSSIKLALSDGMAMTHATARAPMETLYPARGHVEQRPDDWLVAFEAALAELQAAHPDAMGTVRGIGLSGHMHALLLLDASGKAVRPASLWNDFRASAETRELAHSGLSERMGVMPMPGLTAPKLLWTRRNDPAALEHARWLAFPKDYLRKHLTGRLATDPTDAAGSWLFDQDAWDWADDAFAACGVPDLGRPEIIPSGSPAGYLDADLARRFGLPPGIPVAAGAGDVAAGAAGIGVVTDGDAMISLGTSAQVFVCRASYAPRTERMVHNHAHVAPGTWYDMAALLNGTSALERAAGWLGYGGVSEMIDEVEARYAGPGTILALPYLSGERTPHDDPSARGAFVGMSASTARWELALSMLEAVAFSLADGVAALDGLPRTVSMVGGGTRSPFFCQIIADVLGTALVRPRNADVGPALGAARLARAAATGARVADCCPALPSDRRFDPDPARHEAYAPRLQAFRRLYAGLSPTFAELDR